MATRSCPFNPGDRVWGYGRDSGGIEQQESVASQRRAIEKYCCQHLSWPKTIVHTEVCRSTRVTRKYYPF
jgi:hypothetical protein